MKYLHLVKYCESWQNAFSMQKTLNVTFVLNGKSVYWG